MSSFKEIFNPSKEELKKGIEWLGNFIEEAVETIESKLEEPVEEEIYDTSSIVDQITEKFEAVTKRLKETTEEALGEKSGNPLKDVDAVEQGNRTFMNDVSKYQLCIDQLESPAIRIQLTSYVKKSNLVRLVGDDERLIDLIIQIAINHISKNVLATTEEIDSHILLRVLENNRTLKITNDEVIDKLQKSEASLRCANTTIVEERGKVFVCKHELKKAEEELKEYERQINGWRQSYSNQTQAFNNLAEQKSSLERELEQVKDKPIEVPTLSGSVGGTIFDKSYEIPEEVKDGVYAENGWLITYKDGKPVGGRKAGVDDVFGQHNTIWLD